MVTVRPESAADHAGVHLVHERAFRQPDEADLVDALRQAAAPQVSLVAEADGRLAGHIFFSPVTLAPACPDLQGMGLAPVGVLPELQSRGIGSQLIRAGLDACRQLGQDFVVVLGHPEYYPRFSFVAAQTYGLRSEYRVPDEAFMALEMRAGALAGRAGLVRYHPLFATLS
jgi:putative acetyltransferase